MAEKKTEKKIQKKLEENEILIGENPYQVKPVKMKYIKNKFYSNYRLIKDIGFMKLISSYSDGQDVLKGFIDAIFDIEDTDKIIDSLDVPTVKQLIKMTEDINEIKEETEKNVVGQKESV